jgi:heat shock protein HslJ
MPSQKIIVTGTLSRVMAIGAESTGWMVQLDSEKTIDGKLVSSIQVSDSRKPERLDPLNNKHVRVIGKLNHRHGVETGEQPFIEVSSIKEAKPAVQPAHAQAAPFSLSGSEWLLEDLGGRGVIDNIQATVTFPEAGKVTGNGSCNRFFGPAEVTGHSIKLGPLASSRMACPEAVMNQETKYLEALQAGERFEWKDPYLLIYCHGWEKPLRFTRLTKPAAP